MTSPADRIRVLYYVPRLTVGGTENQLLLLASGLGPEFEPLVWCPGPSGPVAHGLAVAGIPVHTVGLKPSDPASIDRAIRWLRSLRVSIFHSFGAGWEWFDTIFARLAGIPVCLNSRRNVSYWDPAGKVHVLQHIRNSGSDLMIANAKAVAEHLARVEGLPAEKIRVVYNGVKMPEPAAPELRRSMGLQDGELLIGNVANLRPVKGQSFLLRAFARVQRQVPEVRLVICGDGRSRSELEGLRNELGLQERVIFLGSQADTDEVYRSLDLYVHPSLSEGFSNAVLEAMAHGLPVIATPVGGTPEAVADGETGLLTPAGDAETLAGALIRLIGDEPARRRMGAAGRDRAQHCFSVAAMVRAYEGIYREFVDRVR